MSRRLPKRPLWKRWADVLLPAFVLAVSVFNFVHRRAPQKTEIFIMVMSGLLTLAGIGRFIVASRETRR